MIVVLLADFLFCLSSAQPTRIDKPKVNRSCAEHFSFFFFAWSNDLQLALLNARHLGTYRTERNNVYCCCCSFPLWYKYTASGKTQWRVMSCSFTKENNVERERERSLWVGCEIERVPREPQTPSLQFRNDSVNVAIPSSSIFNELGTLPLKM